MFVVKLPKGEEGPERNTGIFSFLDLAPSALNWLGISPPSILPGHMIAPEFFGHEAIPGMDSIEVIVTRIGWQRGDKLINVRANNP